MQAGQKKLGTLGTLLLCFAVLAGGAQAAERPDDRAGLLGVGGTQIIAAPDAFERAVIRAEATVPVPDVFERTVARELAISAVVRPDDRGGARGPGHLTPATVERTAASADDGFAWGDALLGVLATFGAVGLAGAAVLSVRSRRAVLR